MPEHPLKQILSKILHGPSGGSDFELDYVHRGAPRDTRTITVSSIKNLRKGSFLLEDMETQIPFHRVLYVRTVDDTTILWRKRESPATPNRSR
jgi:uncharacterized protein (UPF0248 family)